MSKLVCKKCGSNNISVQVINVATLKDRHHGCFWWLTVGWWWIPVKWICFTVPALIFALFGHKKQRIVNKQKAVRVCQNCGYTW